MTELLEVVNPAFEGVIKLVVIKLLIMKEI